MLRCAVGFSLVAAPTPAANGRGSTKFWAARPTTKSKQDRVVALTYIRSASFTSSVAQEAIPRSTLGFLQRKGFARRAKSTTVLMIAEDNEAVIKLVKMGYF